MQKFDFGHSLYGPTPVADGFVDVPYSSAYDGSLGYGWVGSIDRFGADQGPSYDDESRDYTYFYGQSEFVVDVANGLYDVELLIGAPEHGYQSTTKVSIEGVEEGTFGTGGGQPYVNPTYTAFVTDGQLNLLFDRTVGQARVNSAVITQLGITIDPTEGSTSVSESGSSDSFTVVLDVQPSGDVTLDLAADATEVTLSSNTLTFTSANWNVPQTVTVTGVVDDIPDDDYLGHVNITADPSSPPEFQAISESIPLLVEDIDVDPSNLQFDFGHWIYGSTPVAAGHTEVPFSSSYESVLGYGWVGSTARYGGDQPSIADDALRDYTYFHGPSEFVVNVPNGFYEVEVLIGAETHPLASTTTVTLEGEYRGTWNTGNGVPAVTPSFTVEVTDGRLNLAVDRTVGQGRVNGLRLTPYGITVVESDESTAVEEGGLADSFSVVLDRQPTADVTLDLAVDGAEVSLSNSQLTFTPTNWNVPRTVSVTGVADLVHDGNQQRTIAISTNVSSAPEYLERAAAVEVAIEDIDVLAADLSFDFGHWTYGATPVQAGFADVPFYTSYASSLGYGWTSSLERLGSDQGAAHDDESRDYTASYGPSEFVVNVPNGVYEVELLIGAPDHPFHSDTRVYLEGAEVGTWETGNSIAYANPSFTVTVSDNRLNLVMDRTFGQARLNSLVLTPYRFTTQQSDGATSVDESGSMDSFTVSLDIQPTANVILDLSADGTEVALSHSQLTFTPTNWNTPQTVTVAGLADEIPDGDQIVDISVAVNTTSALEFLGLSSVISVLNTDADLEASSLNFDFGHWTYGTTPVAPGFAEVAFSSSYSSSLGYGWISPEDRAGYDQGAAYSDEARDYTYSWDSAEFAINLPNGYYFVEALIGAPDHPYPSTTRVSLEGVEQGVWATGNNQPFVNPSFDVGVTDGRLNLYLDATSGQARINALSVTPYAASIVESDNATVVSENGTSDSFEVTLDIAPQSDVVIDLSTTDAGEFTLSTNQLIFTPANWNVPQTVSVTGVDDIYADGTQNAYVEMRVNEPLSDPNFGGRDVEQIPVSIVDRQEFFWSIEGNVLSAGGSVDDDLIHLEEVAGRIVVEVNGQEWPLNTSTATLTQINVEGFSGNDTLSISSGIGTPTRLTGGAGDDSLTAGGGPATLIGGSGMDNLLGGPGDDRLAIDERDVFAGGAGTDTVDASEASTGITLDMGAVSVEVFEGSRFDDHVSAGALSVGAVIHAGEGDDVLTGSIHIDEIQGGPGNDFIVGLYGADNLDGGSGANTVIVGASLEVTSPGQNTTIFGPTPTITWEAAADAVSYEVQISEAGGNVVLSNAGLLTTSYTVATGDTISGNALPDGDYEVRVRFSSADSSTSNWGGTQTFQLKTQASAIVSPASSAYTYARLPELSWSAIPDAASYEIWLSEVNSHSVLIKGGITSTAYTITSSDLPNQQQLNTVPHRLWVRPFDAFGNAGPWSAASDFIVAEPSVFITGPEVLASNTSITLQWSGAAASASSYNVLVRDLTADNVTVIDQSNVLPESLTLTGLTHGHTYRAWVQPVDELGVTGAWSSAHEFLVNTASVAQPGIEILPFETHVVSESGTHATYEIQLSEQPSAPVTLAIGVSDSTEVTVDQLSLTFDSFNWNIPQQFSVTGVDDSLADGNVAVTVNVFVAAGSDSAFLTASPGTIKMLVLDDEPEVTEWDAASLSSSISAPWTHSSGHIFSLPGSGSTQLWNLPVTPGKYRVMATWDASSNRATNTPFTFSDGGHAPRTVVVDQQRSPKDRFADGWWWKSMGTVDVGTGQLSIELSNDTDGWAVVREFRIERIRETPGVSVVESDGFSQAIEGQQDSVSVALTAVPESNVVIDVITDPAVVTSSAASLTFTPANWNTPQTVPLTAVSTSANTISQHATVTLAVNPAASAPDYATVPDQTLDFHAIEAANVVRADVDGDGVEDLLRYSGDYISVARITAEVTTTEHWQIRHLTDGQSVDAALTQIPEGADLLTGDLNGDGSTDLFFYTAETDSWRILTAAGGTFYFQERATGGSWDPAATDQSPVIADFTSDGRDDLAYRSPANGQWVIESTDGLQFLSAVWEEESNIALETLGAADVNGDGRSDIVQIDPVTGDTFVSVSTGNSFITSQWSAGLGYVPQETLFGDVNGDGRDDLVTFDSASSSWSVKFSTGTEFALSIFGPSTVPSDARLIDVNEDGRDDLVARGSASQWHVGTATVSGFVTETWTGPQGAEWFASLTLAGSSVEAVDYHYRTRTALETFEELRNSVEFTPSYGHLKGAEATAAAQAGNAWDQAALLAERLDGIVDYELRSGTVRLDIASLNNWLGTYALDASVGILQQARLNPVIVDDPATGTPAEVEFLHAWLEADLAGSSGMQPTRLDPALKRNGLAAPSTDAAPNFSLQDFLAPDALSTAQMDFNGSNWLDPQIVLLEGGGTTSFAHGRNAFYTNHDTSFVHHKRGVNGAVTATIFYGTPWEIVGRKTDSTEIGIRMTSTAHLRLFRRVNGVEEVLKEQQMADFGGYWREATLTIDDRNITATLNSSTLTHTLGGVSGTDPYTIEEGFFGVNLGNSAGALVGIDDVTVTVEAAGGKSVASHLLGDGQKSVPEPRLLPVNPEAFGASPQYTNTRTATGGWTTTESATVSFELINGTQSITIGSAAAYQLSDGAINFKASETPATLDVELLVAGSAPVHTSHNVSWTTETSLKVTFTDPVPSGQAASTRVQSFTLEPNSIGVLNVDTAQDTVAATHDDLATIDEQFKALEDGSAVSDALAYETLRYVGKNWFAESADAARKLGLQNGTRSVRPFATAGLVAAEQGLTVDDDASFYVSVAGLQMDQPGPYYVPVLTGYFPQNAGQVTAENLQAQAMLLSTLEADAIRNVSGTYTNSTATAFGIQAANAIKFYHLVKNGADYTDKYDQASYTATQLETALNHTSQAESALISYLDAGFEVIVGEWSQQVNEWNGTPFLLLDVNSPHPSAQSLLLSDDGVIRHGAISGSTEIIEQASTTDAVLNADAYSGIAQRNDIDVTLPAEGVPVTFSRTWRADSVADNGLGRGWSHSFSDSLIDMTTVSGFNGSGFLWIDSNGSIFSFLQVNGTTDYITPQTLPGAKLEQLNNTLEMRLTFKDGSSKTFEKLQVSGVYNSHLTLTKTADRHNNIVRLSYSQDTPTGSPNLLDRVFTSSPGVAERELLSFTWDGNRIAAVTDFTGRHWQYAYETSGVSTRLTAVDGPLLSGEAATPDDRQFSYVWESVDATDPAADHLLAEAVSVTDGSTKYSYFENQRLRTATSASGGVYRYRYDQPSGKTIVLDPENRRTDYLYGADGTLSGMSYADGGRTEHTWDHARNLMTSTITAGLGRTEMTYDSEGLGNLITRLEPTGVLTTYSYTGETHHYQVETIVEDPTPTAPGGGDERTVLENFYTSGLAGAEGNPTSSQNALGELTTYTYTQNGRLETVTTPRGNVAGANPLEFTTEFSYHVSGGINSTILPGPAAARPQTSATLDDLGRVETATDETLITTSYSYDRYGNLLSQTSADPYAGTVNALGMLSNTYEFDANRRMASRTTTDGATFHYDYDPAGRVTRETAPDGTYTRYEYNPDGTVSASVDVLGRQTKYFYDSRGRQSHVVRPDSSVESSVFDSNGALVTAIDPRGFAAYQSFDQFGRLTSRVDAAGNSTSIAYDEYSRIAEETDALNVTVELRYDDLDRIVRTQTADVSVTRFFFDENGNEYENRVYDLSGLTPSQIPADLDQLEARRRRVNQTRFDRRDRTYEWVDAAQQVRSVQLDDAGRVISETNEQGHTTNYVLDDIGRVKTITLPAADSSSPRPEATQVLDASGRVVRETDAEGRVTTHRYDVFGRQTATTDALDGVLSTQFDALGRLAQTIDAEGRATGYEYDDLDRTTMVAQPALNTGEVPMQTWTHDANGNVIATVDALGRTTTTIYNELNQAVSVTQPAGQSGVQPTTTMIYDAAGNLRYSTDQLQRQTEYQYNELNQRVKTILPALEGVTSEISTTAVYDAFGNMLESIDAEGRKTVHEYDALNRPVKTTHPDPDPGNQIDNSHPSPVESWDFDELGNLRFHTDARSAVTEFRYDNLSRLTEVIQPQVLADGVTLSPVTSHTYDLVGNRISTTDPKLRVTQFVFDPLNRQVETILPAVDYNGAVVTASQFVAYDAVGNVLSTTDAMGRVTELEYDPLNRLVATIAPPVGDDATRPVSSMTYDLVGNVLTESDALGRTTTHEYDDLNRRITTTLPDPDPTDSEPAPVISQYYDVLGRLEYSTDSLGRTTNYEYDNWDRLDKTILPAPDPEQPSIRPSTTVMYDLVGNVVQETDALSNVTQTFYDDLNRPYLTVLPDPDPTDTDPAPEIETRYDANGNVVETHDALGRVTTYFYDSLNRLERTVLPDPDPTDSSAAPFTLLTYDAVGNVRSQTDLRNKLTTFEYDAWNRLTEEHAPRVLYQNALRSVITETTWDLAGNRLSTVDPMGHTTYFAYDNLNRLLRTVTEQPDQVGPLITITENVYDIVGNVVSSVDALGRTTGFVFDDLNRLTKTILPDPDDDGPLTSPLISQTLDNRGNVVTSTDARGHVTQYAYDDWDRLTETTLPDPDNDPNSGESASVTSTKYDHAGNVVESTDALGRVTIYGYDNLYRQTSVELPDPDGDGPLTSVIVINRFDDIGNLIEVDDQGRITTYRYDGLDRNTQILSPVPDEAMTSPRNVTEFEYDNAGNVVSSTDAEGRVTVFVYDDHNRLTNSILPHPDPASTAQGPLLTTTYDLNGNVLTEKDGRHKVTTYHWDGWNRKTRTILPDVDAAGEGLPQITETVVYDHVGNVIAVEDHLGRRTESRYDNLNRLILETLPDADLNDYLAAPYTATTYDPAGNVDTTTDALGRTTTYVYDALNRNTRIIQPDPDPDDTIAAPYTEFTFNKSGTVATSRDARGYVTTFGYDNHDRLIEELLPAVDGVIPTRTTKYDQFGNIESTTNEKGQTTSFRYDRLDRQTKVTSPAVDLDGVLTSPITEHSYDKVGNVTDTIDPNGLITRRVYDSLDRVTDVHLISVSTGSEVILSTTSSEYDFNDNLTASIDAEGRRTLWHYDALNRPITEIRPHESDAQQVGPVLQTIYDEAGNVQSQVDALGKATTFQYDRLNRQVLVTSPDPDGAAGPLVQPFSRTTYDNVGNIRSTTDHLSRVVTFAYDDLNRLTTETHPDPDGPAGPQISSVIETTYDNAGNVLTVTDANDNLTVYEWDELGRQARVTQPAASSASAAGTIVYAYDLLNNTQSITDAMGRTTVYKFDALDREIERILPDPDGSGPANPLNSPRVLSDYDLVGNLTLETDDNGRETKFVYDELYRQEEMILPDPVTGLPNAAFTYFYTYDLVGNKRTTTDPRGNITTSVYDRLDRLELIRHPNPVDGTDTGGPVTSYTYDNAGNLRTETDPLNRVTTHTYDSLNRLTTTTGPDPDGTGPQFAALSTLVYDNAGNVATSTERITSQDAQTTTSTYDTLDRLVTSTDSRGGVTAYEYDRGGNLLKLTDAEGSVTTWTYDGLDRVVTETDPLGLTMGYEYDLVGNQQAMVNRRGLRTEYDFDNLDRRTEERWMDGVMAIRTLSWEYDDRGRLDRFTDIDQSGVTLLDTNYVYDEQDRLTDQTMSGNSLSQSALSWQYDLAGNLDVRTQTIGSDVVTTTYNYDGMNRLDDATQTGTSLTGTHVDLTYYADSRLQTVSRYADAAGTQLAVQSSHQYDGAGRLTDLDHTDGSVTLSSYDYTYNAAGWITNTDSLLDQQSEYAYDGTGQLVTAGHDTQDDEVYNYDLAGNRTGLEITVGVGNRIERDAQFAYAYDEEGNRIRRTRLVNGHPVGETLEYEWDYRNRLIAVRHRDSAGVEQKQITYEYDSDGMRIASHVTEAETTVSTTFVYDGDQLVAEVDGSGSVAQQYFDGPGIDQIFADENALGDVLWPLTDHQGTVRDLAGDNAGSMDVLNHRTLDAFGNIVTESDASVEHNFAFAGRYWDEDAQLFYNRARWYDPESGTFISEDPLRFDAGDANITRYSGNNPVNYIDPSGESWLSDAWDYVSGFHTDLWDDIGNVFEDVGDFIGEQWDNGNIQKILLGAATIATVGTFAPLAVGGFTALASATTLTAAGAAATSLALPALALASAGVNAYEGFSGDQIGDGTLSRSLSAATILGHGFAGLADVPGEFGAQVAAGVEVANAGVAAYELLSNDRIGDGTLATLLTLANNGINHGRTLTSARPEDMSRYKHRLLQVDAGIKLASGVTSVITTGDERTQQALRTLSIVRGLSSLVSSVSQAAATLQVIRSQSPDSPGHREYSSRPAATTGRHSQGTIRQTSGVQGSGGAIRHAIGGVAGAGSTVENAVYTTDIYSDVSFFVPESTADDLALKSDLSIQVTPEYSFDWEHRWSEIFSGSYDFFDTFEVRPLSVQILDQYGSFDSHLDALMSGDPMASQIGPFSDEAMAEYEQGVWRTTLTRLQDNLGIAGGEYKSAARGYRAGSVSHADWQKAWAKKQAAQDALQDHTGQYRSVFTGLEVLGYGRPDSVSGAIWEGAKYGVSGGGSIVSNTFTFGATDYFGLTTSYAYQGAGFDESRIASIASRELLITAGTAGLGHVLKGGSAVYTAKTVGDTARGATALRAIASPLARAGARFAGQSLTTMRIARGLQTTSLAYEGYQLGNSGVSAYEAFSREEYGWGLFHVGTGALSAWGLGESVRTFGSSTRAYRDMLSATGNRTLVGLNGKAVRLGNIELYPQGFYSPSLPGVRSAQPSGPRVAEEVAALRRIAANNRTESARLLHQKINLRGDVARRYGEVVESQSNAQRGPVLAGVMDRKTGRVFLGQNTGVPSELHPITGSRLRDYPDDWASIYEKAAPGTHAEFVALNDALLARPDADIGDFLVYTVWLRGSRKGLPIPRCPHCETLTDGTYYFPEALRYSR